MAALLVLVVTAMCLTVVESQNLHFVDNLDVVEGEEASPRRNDSQHEDSKLQPYTKDVNHIVIPKMVEKTNNNSKELSYVITLGKSHYVLHLVHNALLVTPGFKVFSYNKSQHLLSENPHISTICYYQGYIENDPHSAVAINVCSGLRGAIYTGEAMYIIGPDGPLLDFRHIMYNVQPSGHDVKCDQNITSLETEGANTDNAMVLPEPQERRTAYLELFMVISYLQFQFHDENTTSLIESMLELINYVNTVFQALNTQIVLVGLEIWSNENFINTETDSADEILSDFLEWKNTSLDNRRITYDAVGLSLRENEMSSPGLARWRGACDPENSAFISVMDRNNLLESAPTFIHDLGHVLGMKHDTLGCGCQSGKLACAMAEEGLLSPRFSDCSVIDMEKFYASDKSSCLWNSPSSNVSSVRVQCGNNMVDTGEECSCGSLQVCQNSVCCNPVTCELKENATCSSGPCCHKCKLTPKGTECRSPKTECDLAEYCDGKSSTCPADVYTQDGSPCNDGQSVCYKKNCYDYTQHCERLFGKGASVAPFSCFQAVNTAGDRFENCSKNGEVLQCNIEDVMCGQIQCSNVSNNLNHHKQGSYVTTPVGDVLCWGLKSHHNGFYEKGAVPNGALCDKGKICMDRKCVDLSIPEYDCKKQKCNGKGVCNNMKNCHCDVNWAPPYCNQSGYGGSVDSGPLTKNSSTRFIAPKQAMSAAFDVVKHWDGSMLTLAAFLSCLQHIL